ncbi:MAG: substrate-binding domain-containing protein [Spirochaetaceae bacterium]|jgi:PAS domain S-box-containing protein|nr:substrate-binding domain-containing protein [Spirochaetaceae bacterium]
MLGTENGPTNPDKKKRPSLGLMVDWIGTPYHREIANGFADYCQEKDLHAFFYVTGRYQSEWESEKCRNILFDFVSGYNVDGLVITSSSIGNLSGSRAVQNLLKDYGQLPLVTIGESFPGIPYIGHDNQQGISMLMDHLIDHHGYTRFAFLRGSEDNQEADTRFNAFMDKLRDRKISIAPENIFSGMFRHEDGRNAVLKLVERGLSQVQVLICSNDIQAMGAHQALKECQVAVPHQLALVGYDDNDFSRYAGFTTIRQSFWEQGRLAAQCCHRQILEEETEQIFKTRPRLILRKSCGCSNPLTPEREKPELLQAQGVESLSSQSSEIVESAMEGVSLPDEERETLAGWLDRLFFLFMQEMTQGTPEPGFLEMWNRIVGWSSERVQIRDILERIRETFLGLLIHSLSQNKPWQDYWRSMADSARTILEQNIQDSLYYDKVLFDYRLEDMDETGERLMGLWGQSEQMDVIAQSFPRMGIKQCYISRYVNPEKPMTLSRLILAYDENHRYPLDERGIQFPTAMLLPHGILQADHRHCLVIQALFQGYQQIGFALFDASNRDWRTLEILRHKISLSLRSADMHEEIRGYTQRLEEQVAQRTRELQDTNKKLQLEIVERQRIEQELRKKEEHFRELALFLPTVIMELDLRMRPTFTNQAGLSLFGLIEENLFRSESLLHFVYEEDQEQAEEYFNKILKLKRPLYGEMRLLDFEKKPVTVLVHASPILKDNLVKGIRISAMRIKPLLSSVVMPEDLFFHHYHFSPRVKEVLLLMLQGYKTPEIAKKLFITESTVKAHIRAIYTETGVKKRSEFFRILEEYQVNHFGYQSYIYSLLSQLIKE